MEMSRSKCVEKITGISVKGLRYAYLFKRYYTETPNNNKW
jgi:hypothetical protein